MSDVSRGCESVDGAHLHVRGVSGIDAKAEGEEERREGGREGGKEGGKEGGRK